jgi:hypothetical protein
MPINIFKEKSSLPGGYILHPPAEKDQFLTNLTTISCYKNLLEDTPLYSALCVFVKSYCDEFAVVPTIRKSWIYCISTFISIADVAKNCV